MANWLSQVSILTRSQLLGWLVAAVLAAFVAGGGFGWWAGSAQGRAGVAEARQSIAETQLQGERQARDRESRAASAAAGVASASAERHARVEIRYQTIEKEVIRYEQTPAAALECLDADGLRLWRSANRGEFAASEPAGAGHAVLP